LFRIGVQVTHLSAERLWDIEHELPPQLQIAINLNLLGFEENGSNLQASFVFTVNFMPAVAQMSIRGHATVAGGKEQLAKIVQENKEQKPPPQQIVQSILNITMAEAVILAKTIGVPPPLPPISSMLPTGSQLTKPAHQNSHYT
jgi:hypothetical protein